MHTSQATPTAGRGVGRAPAHGSVCRGRRIPGVRRLTKWQSRSGRDRSGGCPGGPGAAGILARRSKPGLLAICPSLVASSAAPSPVPSRSQASEATLPGPPLRCVLHGRIRPQRPIRLRAQIICEVIASISTSRSCRRMLYSRALPPRARRPLAHVPAKPSMYSLSRSGPGSLHDQFQQGTA